MTDSTLPDAAAVREAIERIIASSDFDVSDRAVKFLRYVVEETLQGRSELIKAFTIGIDVFERDEGFDPQHDPVVRIEAARLRRAMERYYLLSGKDDPIRIDIPKGSYVPTFTAGSAESETVSETRRASGISRWWLLAPLVVVLVLFLGWVQFGNLIGKKVTNTVMLGPRILVLPFTDLGNDDMSATYAAAITDELIGALSHFKEVAVFGVQTSRSVDGDSVASLREKLRVDYVLEGSARTDAHMVRVGTRLIDAASGAVLWSNSYEYQLEADKLFEIPVDTAAAVARTVAQPRGIIFSEASMARLSKPPSDLDAYFCTLRTYIYRNAPTPEAHGEARDCLKQTVTRHPAYATAWALLALADVDEIRYGFNRESNPGERALDAAQRAVRLDPENTRALQALATAFFFTHDPSGAFEASERALALNSNDSELLGQLGQIFGLAGQAERGRELLEKAILLNPGQAEVYEGALAVVCYLLRDYACAKTAIENSDAHQVPTYYGIAAMIYAQLGLEEKAHAAAAEFNRVAPDFAANLWSELSIRNIPFEDQVHIAEGFQKAGLTVPPADQAGE